VRFSANNAEIHALDMALGVTVIRRGESKWNIVVNLGYVRNGSLSRVFLCVSWAFLVLQIVSWF